MFFSEICKNKNNMIYSFRGEKGMAVTHQSTLREGLLQALQKAQETQKTILISQVKEISNIDSLAFFAMGKKIGMTNRMYWEDPFDSLTYVGLGASYKIKSESGNRFKEIESQWRKLVIDSIILPSDFPPNTGPILSGGFSFDVLKEKTKLWKDFPDSYFVLPTFLLTRLGKEQWITLNVMVEPDQDKSEFDSLLDNLEALMEANELILKDSKSLELNFHEVKKDEWIDSVKHVTEEIKRGKLEKVVLARELSIESTHFFDVESILNRLQKEQSTSYLFAFENNGTCFLGASPERLIKMKNNEFLSTCLAGSIGRGATAVQDDELGQALLSDEKNIHEHALVVEMIKQAMEAGCEKIHIPDTPVLYKVRDIQHLYTPIQGIAKKDVSLFRMVESLHPTPALGGFPKDKSMEKIREVELMDRGWYAAPIGWVDARGNGEFAVAIRSGIINKNKASLFAGCGIVSDSDPISEYEETKMKFRPMLTALGGLE